MMVWLGHEPLGPQGGRYGYGKLARRPFNVHDRTTSATSRSPPRLEYMYRLGRWAFWLPRQRTAACCGVGETARDACMNISAFKHAMRCMYGDGIEPVLHT